LTCTILSELYDPGKQAKAIEQQAHIRSGWECITFRWYNELSFEEILKHAAALPPQAAIFWHLMNVGAAGVVHEDDKALKRLYYVSSFQ
jgi:hypothetical protein